MLAVIAQLDRLNVLLFHVEQSIMDAWEYRVSVRGGPPGDRVQCAQDHVFLPVPSYSGPLSVEWRWRGDEEWTAAVPHCFGEATAEFAVRVEAEFDPSRYDHVTVCGVVRGHPSAWKLQMPPWKVGLNGPEVLKVAGVSCCAGLGQVLRGEGEFQCAGSGLQVMNAGPSQAALLPVADAVPAAMPFQAPFFVTTGRLSADEIETLRREVACLG